MHHYLSNYYSYHRWCHTLRSHRLGEKSRKRKKKGKGRGWQQCTLRERIKQLQRKLLKFQSFLSYKAQPLKDMFDPLNISKISCIAILWDTLISKRSLMSSLFKYILCVSKGDFNRELDLPVMPIRKDLIVICMRCLVFVNSHVIMWDVQRSIYERVSHDLENRCVPMRGSEITFNLNMYDWIVIVMVSEGSRGPHLQASQISFEWTIIRQFGIYMVGMMYYAR